MKHIISTVIGLILFFSTIGMVAADMYYSNSNPDYHFDLKWWHPVIGIIISSIFIFFEPNDIKKIIQKGIDKKLK